MFLLTGMIAFDLGLAFTFIVTLIMGLARWRKTSRSWIGPTLLCVVFILSILFIRNTGVFVALGDRQFMKHRDDYTSIVDQIKTGAVPCGSSLTKINIQNVPSHISSVWAARCPDGSIFVEFNLKPHIPQTSRGYLFKNYAETNNCFDEITKPEHRYHLSHITGNWYEFRN